MQADYLDLLLSVKLQIGTISLSAMPINRCCVFLFWKASPLSQRVKAQRMDCRGYPRSSINLFRNARRNCSSQCSTWAWYAPSWPNLRNSNCVWYAFATPWAVNYRATNQRKWRNIEVGVNWLIMSRKRNNLHRSALFKKSYNMQI